jgi:hypothetical protein
MFEPPITAGGQIIDSLASVKRLNFTHKGGV